MSGANARVEGKLKEYLQSRMPEAEGLEIARLSRGVYGASRETFVFDLCWQEAGVKKTQALVLRRDPPTGLLDQISRDTEFRILKSLQGSGIPAPQVLWCETDPAFLERPFILMERVDGNVNQSFQRFAASNPELRNQIAEGFVEILARIHNLDWHQSGLDFLGPPLGPLDYAKRELAKWEAILDKVKLEPDPILTEARLWLRSNLTPAEEVCLVHGDYKLDNVMHKKDRIVAIFDWELAGLGDPHDDLGWVCMRYYEVDGLLNGLMEREWFLRRYQELSGRTLNPAAIKFWQVFSNLKMAAISLTGAQRYISGAAKKNVLAILPLLMPKIHRDIIELLGW